MSVLVGLAVFFATFVATLGALAWLEWSASRHVTQVHARLRLAADAHDVRTDRRDDGR